MNLGKIKLYISEIFLLIFLFLAIFEFRTIPKFIISIILIIFLIVLKKILKKRNTISIYSKQLTILLSIFAFIYLVLFYTSGLYFNYYESTVKFNITNIFKFIIPTILIVYSSEKIRYILLSQKGRFNQIFTFLSMVLIDILVYTQIFDLTKLNDFLTILGFITFSSISCNLFYNYTSKRFGYQPIIVYRVITSIYMFIIPFIPDVYLFFRSVVRMLFPYIYYLILDYTYSEKVKNTSYKDKSRNLIITTITACIMFLIAGLVSCQFKYCVLVVGSGSMTGTINKGDISFFEKYDKNKNKIKVGDIIIFKINKNQIIHRVVKKEIVNNKYRFYTKGDANEENDNWYVKEENIVGKHKFKIKYLGYPTIWVNDIFN